MNSKFIIQWKKKYEIYIFPRGGFHHALPEVKFLSPVPVSIFYPTNRLGLNSSCPRISFEQHLSLIPGCVVRAH